MCLSNEIQKSASVWNTGEKTAMFRHTAVIARLFIVELTSKNGIIEEEEGYGDCSPLSWC
jgi:hypothetical protein